MVSFFITFLLWFVSLCNGSCRHEPHLLFHLIFLFIATHHFIAVVPLPWFVSPRTISFITFYFSFYILLSIYASLPFYMVLFSTLIMVFSFIMVRGDTNHCLTNHCLIIFLSNLSIFFLPKYHYHTQPTFQIFFSRNFLYLSEKA